MGYGQYSHQASPGTPGAPQGERGRIKRVFTDASEVAHLWAHQAQDSARYRDNFSFQGRALYSYRTIIGYIMPDNVILVNPERYSVTTSGHQSTMRYATNHMRRIDVPGLDRLAERLDRIETQSPRDVKRNDARDITDSPLEERRAGVAATNATTEIVSFIKRNPEAPEACLYLGSRIGLTAKQIAALIAKAERDAAKAKAKAERRERDRLLALGAMIVAAGDSWREGIQQNGVYGKALEAWPRDGERQWSPGDGSKPYELQAALTYGTTLARIHKAAKEAGRDKLAAALWTRVKEYRAHVARRNARIWQAYRDKLARDLRAWRRGEGEHAKGLNWRGSAGETLNVGALKPRTKAIVQRVAAARYAKQRNAEFAAWQDGERDRPMSHDYVDGTPERAAVWQDVLAERERFVAAFAAWQTGDGPRPELPTGEANAHGLYHAERQAIERDKREIAERDKREREAAARAAWLDGTGPRAGHYSDERGGALLRIVGDELETSHGATVPLAHAVKAFRFVKFVRERRTGWRRNGQQIRVGHYSLDSIEPSGDFVAGCHRINWPEIERVAKLAGVWEAEPSADAVNS